MQKIAKLIVMDGSQFVRLPDEFRFSSDQVYARRHASTGDVTLSVRPRSSWAEFMAARKTLGSMPDDFLDDRAQDSEAVDPLQALGE